MFDLPTITERDRKNYTQFRKRLIQSGYFMLQFSIYVKICKNHEDGQRKIKTLKSFIPSSGQIRGLVITDKQYQKMLILLGEEQEWEFSSRNKDNTIFI